MQARDGVFLEDLCPKLRARRWRSLLHKATQGCCLYCGAGSESIDHVHPLSRGGQSVTENCVPACLACNGRKGDADAFDWYRRQPFYDPRRAMALRAWTQGDLSLALRLLSWVGPADTTAGHGSGLAGGHAAESAGDPRAAGRTHQTRQASTPAWRWQIAS
ncbi:MAG: HNH endonuclease signature motif containing protein [Cyanobacteriota bacterium]|nr:HNH endonuclease signature motif containing protein [Cyanobacteriota bacterium]